MNHKYTLNEYQQLAIRTVNNDKPKNMRVAEFSVALCEEAGESAGVLKKVIFHDHPYTAEKEDKLIEELGDTLWHIAAIANEYGIPLALIAKQNIDKLKRRYPEGFSTERSVNREN
jgi:NTP pyrophosphatase (non-canonical NTP hydrolase)